MIVISPSRSLSCYSTLVPSENCLWVGSGSLVRSTIRIEFEDYRLDVIDPGEIGPGKNVICVWDIDRGEVDYLQFV